MNYEIEASKRRLTVIVDPHIKYSLNYFIFVTGMIKSYLPQT
jgi:hypothetical protein